MEMSSKIADQYLRKITQSIECDEPYHFGRQTGSHILRRCQRFDALFSEQTDAWETRSAERQKVR